MLSNQHQTRLSELLAETKANPLSNTESAELDTLLERVDQMNILKTRALLTLQKTY